MPDKMNSMEDTDLELKIEQLLKGLFALKEQQGPLVPAIKPTQVSSPSQLTGLKPSIKFMSSPAGGIVNNFGGGKVPAPKPIPGGTGPASQKDPAKMAEQLKNPRPTKPPVEILKVETNGQWTLSKSFDGTPQVHVPNIKPTVVPPSSTPTPILPSPAPVKPLVGPVDNQTKAGSIAAPRRRAAATAPISAEKHGWSTHESHQNSLIDGLDVYGASRVRDSAGKNVGVAGAAFATSGLHPHTAVIKNSSQHSDRLERGHLDNGFNSARREVLFHDMAHKFFELGDHVPTTAGFTHNGHDWSAQKKVDGASHVTHDLAEHPLKGIVPKMRNPNHERVIREHNDSGQLDKLTIMDHIMGHHDRHSGNFLVDDKGDGLHLIDNGTAFDYSNFDMHPHPRYRKIAQDMASRGDAEHDNSLQLHPEATEWLSGLDPQEAKKLFMAHGHEDDSPAVRGFMDRLTHLQDGAKRQYNYNHMDDLFEEGKDFSHQGPKADE